MIKSLVLFGLLLCFVSYSAYSQAYFIKIIQADTTYSIEPGTTTLTLDKKPFTIQTFVQQYNEKAEKYYSIQIATLTNVDDPIQVGQTKSEVKYFDLGTGMAPNENGMYESFFLTEDGHHYIFYENKKSKRANLLSQLGDMMEVEIPVKMFYYLEKDVAIKDLNLSQLLLVIFIDKNLNSIIDANELAKIIVEFK